MIKLADEVFAMKEGLYDKIEKEVGFWGKFKWRLALKLLEI